ncbi:hypothetical protein predicted by Glimmer/Critica (plasmid) [Acetobacter ghanensis]|uniref:Uncharacterized protein n=1 Tax=Acetobacter ghanensis TaxID=431306 RepID=A0A0U5FAK9_9PROT|nr:hypothetical protein predicted by Glimmer/Critica [Acetobacter ghanensis]
MPSAAIRLFWRGNWNGEAVVTRSGRHLEVKCDVNDE